MAGRTPFKTLTKDWSFSRKARSLSTLSDDVTVNELRSIVESFGGRLRLSAEFPEKTIILEGNAKP